MLASKISHILKIYVLLRDPDSINKMEVGLKVKYTHTQVDTTLTHKMENLIKIFKFRTIYHSSTILSP